MITQLHTPDGVFLVDVPDPELDRINEILGTSPDVISMPEIWELLRLFARRHGWFNPD